jgi:hypothetical protein
MIIGGQGFSVNHTVRSILQDVSKAAGEVTTLARGLQF